MTQSVLSCGPCVARLVLFVRFGVTSVALCNSRLSVNFRYAPVSDRDRVAVQYVAKGQ